MIALRKNPQPDLPHPRQLVHGSVVVNVHSIVSIFRTLPIILIAKIIGSLRSVCYRQDKSNVTSNVSPHNSSGALLGGRKK